MFDGRYSRFLLETRARLEQLKNDIRFESKNAPMSASGYPEQTAQATALWRNIDIQIDEALRKLALFESLPTFERRKNGCIPKVIAIASTYLSSNGLQISADGFSNFLKAAGVRGELRHNELVLLMTALQISVLLFFADKSPQTLGNKSTPAIDRLTRCYRICETLSSWSLERFVCENLSYEDILRRDPAGIYQALDAYSKNLYRRQVERMSAKYHIPTERICGAALELASKEEIADDVRMRVRSHVGHYLLEDDGAAMLLRHLGARPVLQFAFSEHALAYYIAATCLLVAGNTVGYILCQPRSELLLLKIVSGIAVGILAGSAASSWIGLFVYAWVPPRLLSRFDLSGGIPEKYTTIVAVPSLLLSAIHVRCLAETLRNHAAACNDPNVIIALLTDFSDCRSQAVSEEEQSLLELCIGLVNDLNSLPEYRHNRPFVLLHRDVRYCDTQNSWIGWERKRGKVQDLMSLAVNGVNSFSRAVGDVMRLRSAEYLIVLDDDSRLTHSSIQQLIGTHIHPFNHPRLDRHGREILRGYGILDPGILALERDPQHSGRQRVARATVGRNFRYDLLRRSLFRGKGCIHMRTYLAVLAGRIPDGRVLSHDVVESGFVRTGAARNIVVLEKFPGEYSTYVKREHRWIRGDWQNVLWLMPWAIKRMSRMTWFGKVMIAEKLSESLSSISVVVLLINSTVNLNSFIWMFGLLVGSDYLMLIMSLWRSPNALNRKLLSCYERLVAIHKTFLWCIVTAAHRAVVSLDAILRTLLRMTTGRQLLEWRTAAASENKNRSLGVIEIYQFTTSIIALGLLILSLFSGNPWSIRLFLLGLWSSCALVRDVNW